MKQNEFNFVGGQMSGLPGQETKATTAKPRAESVPKQDGGKILTHTPQQAVQSSLDDTMRLVPFSDLVVGACFMREYKQNCYMVYTKSDEKAWPSDYQVLIFKRHEKVYLKAAPKDYSEIEAMASELREETRRFNG
jgi:hypothetical protein